MCTSDIRDVIKHLMACVGSDPARFGAHSLRIGGATAALSAGVPPQTIRLMGRWSSDCYDVYLRLTRRVAAQFSAVVGSTAFEDFDQGFRTEELEVLPYEMGDFDVDDASDCASDEDIL